MLPVFADYSSEELELVAGMVTRLTTAIAEARRGVTAASELPRER
jgi:hypothetical protein